MCVDLLTKPLSRILTNQSWPGNVRELQNVIERAIILCGDNEMLGPEHLGLGISEHLTAPHPATSAPAFTTSRGWPETSYAG